MNSALLPGTPLKPTITSSIAKGARLFALSKEREVLGDAIPISFDISMTFTSQDTELMNASAKSLLDIFNGLVREPVQTTRDVQLDDEDAENRTSDAVITDTAFSVFGNWKEVKNRSNIRIHKKRIQQGLEPAELYRSITPINCDTTRVVGVLSNPRHFQLLHENFSGTKILYNGK